MGRGGRDRVMYEEKGIIKKKKTSSEYKERSGFQHNLILTLKKRT